MRDDQSHTCPNRRVLFLMFITCLYFISCAQSDDQYREPAYQASFHGEAISFLGDTLITPQQDDETFRRNDSLLQEAWESFAADSNDLDNIIWLGRRLAYQHRYREAIDVYSRGIEIHPASPELFRHRGHRYLTIRKPELAIADLEHGIALASTWPRTSEPDGIPNKLFIPLSNLHFNLYYHLGLAYYFKGDFVKALATFRDCMKHADNNDLLVASSDWLYLSSIRSGDTTSAQSILHNIHADMEIIENEVYLRRLLLYKNEGLYVPAADSVTEVSTLVSLYYGQSCLEEFHGRYQEASRLRKEILDTGLWPAFSFIAAEADSSRLKRY